MQEVEGGELRSPYVEVKLKGTDPVELRDDDFAAMVWNGVTLWGEYSTMLSRCGMQRAKTKGPKYCRQHAKEPSPFKARSPTGHSPARRGKGASTRRVKASPRYNDDEVEVEEADDHEGDYEPDDDEGVEEDDEMVEENEQRYLVKD